MRLNMDKKSHAAVALSVDLDALMGDPFTSRQLL